MADVPPNQTVYISNINDKVAKEELRKCLYALMSQFGPILDVVAMKSMRLRGQAFVVFKEIASATMAIRKLQGFQFFDKPIKLTYSKNKSDIVAKMEGNFEPRDKTAKVNEKKRKAQEEHDEEPASKRLEIAPGQSVPGPGASQAAAAQETLPPNRILFVQNLPENMVDSHLAALFQRYAGFKDVKLISSKNVAFVEFDNDMNATTAMMAFQNFRFSPEKAMIINYAKQ